MKKRVIFLLLLTLLCLTNITVFAGSKPKDLPKSAQDDAKELYQYLISTGYSKETAAAVLGNADQESSVSSGWGGDGHYGCFQCTSEAMQKCKKWCNENNLDDTKPVNQYKYIEKTRLKNDFKQTCNNYTFDDWKKETNIEKATEGFMVAYERCVGGEYALTKIILKSNYGNYKYQDGKKRIEFAKDFYKFFEGVSPAKGTSSGKDANGDGYDDGSGQFMNGSGIMMKSGVYCCENQISSWVSLDEPNIWKKYLEDASRDDLSSKELSNLNNWENNINKSEESNGLVGILRIFVSFLGIIFTVWTILLYLAYWMDRLNTLIDLDFLKLLTFGRLVKSPDEDECTFNVKDLGNFKDTQPKTVNHKAILNVCIISFSFGVLLVSGVFYKILSVLIFKLLNFLG